MFVLISQLEIEECLLELEISRYYVLIDMRGAMTLMLPPELLEQEADILSAIEQVQMTRETNSVVDLLHPFIGIDFDHDTDEETMKRFANRKFVVTKYTQQLNSWKKTPFEELKEENTTKPLYVTFYSYKGGVGRSTSLAVIARLLASKGLRVAVIDLDLEAPGINSLLLTRRATFPFGVVDYLYQRPWMKERIGKDKFLENFIVKEEVPRSRRRSNKNPGQLWVMAAGGMTLRNKNVNSSELLFADLEDLDLILDPFYLKKLSYIDFDLYGRGGNNAFEDLLTDVGSYTEADVILLDARTGISNVGGALLHKYSDLVSIHVQDNKQNREGIALLVEQLGEQDITLLQKIIWSQTKVSRYNKHSKGELEAYIRMQLKDHFKNTPKMDKEIEGKDFTTDLNTEMHMLPFMDDLEDVSAEALKEMVEDDSLPAPYKKLAEEIARKTNSNKTISFYNITLDEKNKIYTDLRVLLASQNNSNLYISTRFLDPSLKWFVGFPGSGKETFRLYLKKVGKWDPSVLQILDYNDFNKLTEQPQQVIAKTIFLDWSLAEAAQATCKFLLQSSDLFAWLESKLEYTNIMLKGVLGKMKEQPEYELPKEWVDEILTMVFGLGGYSGRGIRQGYNIGWNEFFDKIQYREGFVLPRDVIEVIEAIINNFVEEEDDEFRAFFDDDASVDQELLDSGSTLFPGLSWHSFNKILRGIGLRKEAWLEKYNPQLLELIKVFNDVVEEIFSLHDVEVDPFQENILNRIEKRFLENKYSLEDFRLLFTEAKNMRIFSTEGKILKLSSIYRLIQ